MSADVLPYVDGERVVAYYVALAMHPELADAPAIVRVQHIDRAVAGLRTAAKRELEPLARQQAIALMVFDEAQRKTWVW